MCQLTHTVSCAHQKPITALKAAAGRLVTGSQDHTLRVRLSRTGDHLALGLGDFMNIRVWVLGYPLFSPCPFQQQLSPSAMHVASLPCHCLTGITLFLCPWQQLPVPSLNH